MSETDPGFMTIEQTIRLRIIEAVLESTVPSTGVDARKALVHYFWREMDVFPDA